MKLNRILAVCILALACLYAPLSNGQTSGGSLVGTVHDPSGAVIPKANVTLTNNQTGVALTTVSTSAGDFNFPVVQSGTYTVTVNAPGFQQSESQNVVVALDKTSSVDVKLQVGAATSTVQVQANSVQLDTTTSQNATTVDAKTYQDLPFAMVGGARSVTAVALIMPGVSMNDGSSYSAPGSAQSQQFSETISGGQAWAGAELYDGLPFLTPNTGGTFSIQPVPVEALGEFTLVENNFSPELGQTPGGIMSYSTRAGTNAFHGEAYEFLRNNDLDAAGYFAPGPGAPVTHQNEFGVNVGGPILIPHIYNGKDKLFFYGFYSGFRLAGSAPFSGETVPTVAEQNGDFSGLVDQNGQQIKIYDPHTYACSGGVCGRQQYDYNGVPNTIDPSTISQPAKVWNQYLLAPQNSSLSNNVFASGVNNANENRWGGRVDYHLKQSDQIYGFFSLGHTLVENYSFGFVPPMNPYGSQYSPNDLDLVRFGWDHTFSPTLLLHLGAGWNRQGESSTPVYSTPIDYGIPGQVPGVVPSIYFLPGTYADNGGLGSSLEKEHGFAYTGFLSWTKGKNNFKLGGLYYQTRAYNLNESNGVLRLLPAETNSASNTDPQSLTTTGDAYASLFAGAFDSYQTGISPFAMDNQYKYAAAYFNDDYKIMPNLTLNLGIRYEVPWTIHTKNDIASMFSPDVANPEAGGIPGALTFQGHGQFRCQCNRLVPTRYVFWQPRVGFAYSVNDKTVVRGGYGLFMSLTGASGTENGYTTQFTDGFNATLSGATNDGGIHPVFYATDGYPSYVPPPKIDPSYDNGLTPTTMDRSAGIPGVVSNWSLSVQRELPHNFILDVAYVGNTAQHLSSRLVIPNQLPIGDVAEYGISTLNALITDPLGQASGVPIPFPNFVALWGQSATVAQALRAYPQYLKVNDARQNQGHSTYESLQAKLQRQFRNGFSTLVSYTWAKQMTNSEDEIGSFNDTAQDTYGRQGEYTNAYDQAPNTVSITYNYDLPFGTGRKYMNHGIAGAIVGGWGVSAIQRYSSGSPMYQIYANTPFGALGAGNYRPDYVPGVSQRPTYAGKFNPRVDPQINANAYTQPVGIKFGNVPKNLSLRSFGFYDEAFSARKDFHIWESANFQFRADFFNAFNRSNFDNINGPTTIPNAGFGIFQSQGNAARSIQLAAKVTF